MKSAFNRRARRVYGNAILAILKPGLAPLIAELNNADEDLKKHKIDWDDVGVDTDGNLFSKKTRIQNL